MKVVPSFGFTILNVATVPAATQIPLVLSTEAPPEVADTLAQQDPVVEHAPSALRVQIAPS